MIFSTIQLWSCFFDLGVWSSNSKSWSWSWQQVWWSVDCRVVQRWWCRYAATESTTCLSQIRGTWPSSLPTAASSGASSRDLGGSWSSMAAKTYHRRQISSSGLTTTLCWCPVCSG